MWQQSYTMHKLWTYLIVQVIANGQANSCASLIDWVRVSSTYHPGVAPAINPMFPATHLNLLMMPNADVALLNHHWGWITTDFPALANSYGTFAEATTNALALMHGELTQQCTEAQVAWDETRALKTPSAKYPNLIASIHHACEVQTDDQLPDLWSLYANTTKKAGM